MLNLIDEHTRESLLVRPERRWSAAKVIEALADVMVVHAGVWAKLWDGSCPYMGHAHAAADAPTWVPDGTTSAATTATTSSERRMRAAQQPVLTTTWPAPLVTGEGGAVVGCPATEPPPATTPHVPA